MVPSPDAPPVDAFSLATDAFLLDVDGTILDIAAAPEAVHVPESLRDTLIRLQAETNGATALVSGRKLDALDSLFAPHRMTAVGCHGAEWRVRAGEPVVIRTLPLSTESKQDFLSAAVGLPPIRIEDKDFTLAFHYRSAPELGPELKARLRQALVPYASELRLLQGKLVFEIKPWNFDKGEAVRELMRGAPFSGRRPVFLGDDTTDEDAFSVVRELGGIGISVGRPMTHADYMLPDPEAARELLAAIVARRSDSAPSSKIS
jgi:trehalose 6-phosphate phosphatase